MNGDNRVFLKRLSIFAVEIVELKDGAMNIDKADDRELTIPFGDSREDKRTREKIIFNFYQRWKQDNPEQKRFNLCLNEDINIRNVSIVETSEHAAKTYLSTLAVLQLDAILTNALIDNVVKADANVKNQRPFDKMILMSHILPGIGKVKLTVGVRRSDGEKVQYCITVIQI